MNDKLLIVVSRWYVLRVGTGRGSGVEIWYLYASTGGVVDGGYITGSDIVNDTSNNLLEQCTFILPIISNANANRFGVQISVELLIVDDNNARVRRRCGLLSYERWWILCWLFFKRWLSLLAKMDNVNWIFWYM